MSAAGLILAAPASGGGKTVLTLGLLAALRRRGVAVGAFKCGPDYIDPAFHATVLGRPVPNIDPWAMRPETRRALLAETAGGLDLLIGEGVMGLFDGAAGGAGSTADLARETGLPVVLVIDARAMAQSAAALLHGFATWDPDLPLAGAIFNRVGSPRHEVLLREAAERAGVPCLGAVPRDPRLELPSRHLGLVQAGELAAPDALIAAAAETVGAALDLEALQALAGPLADARPDARPLSPLGRRIAVARDAAFAFVYESVLSGWRRDGAEIVTFSPLDGEGPPEDADAIYLPGGYPELVADRLAANDALLGGLALAARRGTTIYGECGGYMLLGEALVDADGRRHAMAGLLPLATSFAEPRLHLGYRQMRLLSQTPLGDGGAGFRGHEFHYARTLSAEGEPLFEAEDAAGVALGTAGLRSGPVFGSFLHLIDRQSPAPP